MPASLKSKTLGLASATLLVVVAGIVSISTASRSVSLNADSANDTSGPQKAKQEEKGGRAKSWKRPTPPGSRDYADTRSRMVKSQISHPPDGREVVKSEPVLEAMRVVPRHVFVPSKRRQAAYVDSPLPIGYGQTISQPYIVAFMTELLALNPDSKVLEVGTGSGYQAAVLAHLTPHVYTIEIVEPLATRAKKAFEEQGYQEIRCRHGDGYNGWKEEAPFDAIIVTCAAGHLPPPLWEQLKPGGRIVVPIGGPFEVQRLVVVTKTADGKRRSKTVMAVRFVPLTRGTGQQDA